MPSTYRWANCASAWAKAGKNARLADTNGSNGKPDETYRVAMEQTPESGNRVITVVPYAVLTDVVRSVMTKDPAEVPLVLPPVVVGYWLLLLFGRRAPLGRTMADEVLVIVAEHAIVDSHLHVRIGGGVVFLAEPRTGQVGLRRVVGQIMMQRGAIGATRDQFAHPRGRVSGQLRLTRRIDRRRPFRLPGHRPRRPVWPKLRHHLRRHRRD